MLVDNDGGPASLAPCFVRIALFTYIYVHSHLLSSSDRITFFSAITFTVWFLTPLVIVHRCLHALGLDVRACFLPVALSSVVPCVFFAALLDGYPCDCICGGCVRSPCPCARCSPHPVFYLRVPFSSHTPAAVEAGGAGRAGVLSARSSVLCCAVWLLRRAP